MEQYVIKGGNPLVGEVEIGGAKNAALAILSAAIMTDETILIENLPDVRDINVLLEAIAGIGAQVDRISRSTVKINGSTIRDITRYLRVNISRRYVHLIIFWELSLVNTNMRRFLFREDAISEAVLLTSI